MNQTNWRELPPLWEGAYARIKRTQVGGYPIVAGQIVRIIGPLSQRGCHMVCAQGSFAIPIIIEDLELIEDAEAALLVLADL